MKMFTMRIELEDLDPPVWRRIKIGATQTLWSLHHVIQSAMGWTNSHPHEFIIKKVHYGETTDETDELGAFFGNEMREESEVILSEVIHSRSRFLYVYDFGDDWRHIVKVEKTEEVKEPIACASVIEGGGNGPPEDVGGRLGLSTVIGDKATGCPRQ